MTLLYYDPLFLEHQTGSHPERPERLIQVMRHLERTGLDRRCRRFAWQPATQEELAQVHERGYEKAIEAFCARGGGRIEVDGRRLWPRAKRNSLPIGNTTTNG